MPNKDQTPGTPTRRRQPASAPEDQARTEAADAAPEDRAATAQPPFDVAELERLRARLVAQYRGRR